MGACFGLVLVVGDWKGADSVTPCVINWVVHRKNLVTLMENKGERVQQYSGSSVSFLLIMDSCRLLVFLCLLACTVADPNVVHQVRNPKRHKDFPMGD